MINAPKLQSGVPHGEGDRARFRREGEGELSGNTERCTLQPLASAGTFTLSYPSDLLPKTHNNGEMFP